MIENQSCKQNYSNQCGKENKADQCCKENKADQGWKENKADQGCKDDKADQCCKDDKADLCYKDGKADLCWLKWMKLGEKTGCHQRADRSFFMKGYQMPVCARCTGVILGYLIAIPTFFLLGFSKFISIGGSAVLLVDWLLQAMGVRKSSNNRRLISGVLGGYGIMSLQLFILKQAVRMLSYFIHIPISK